MPLFKGCKLYPTASVGQLFYVGLL